jgi:hypothetical protein
MVTTNTKLSAWEFRETGEFNGVIAGMVALFILGLLVQEAVFTYRRPIVMAYPRLQVVLLRFRFPKRGGGGRPRSVMNIILDWRNALNAVLR